MVGWGLHQRTVLLASRPLSLTPSSSVYPVPGTFRVEYEEPFVHQTLGVLLQRAIFPGKFAARILHQLAAALIKIITLLYQLLTCVD